MTKLDEFPPVVFLMGPTASGKTDLALEIVQSLPCEIVSVDSAMIYRGMDIGTAKPEPDVLRRAPHRLIDFLDPAETYSAAQFREDAQREIKDIIKGGKVPILVGGTMLYFRALEYGLSELPPADPTARARIEALAEQQGWAKLHERLQTIDPLSAARIHPNDRQRLQRALEVYEITGVPLSELYARSKQKRIPYRLLKLAHIPQNRRVLHERIAHRFQRMLIAGFVGEVKQLRGRQDLDANKSSMRAVGYRQAWEYLQGDLNYETMIEKAIFATRQLAKRQLTWLRSESNVYQIDAQKVNQAQLVKVIAANIG